jgi:hypothetical protein
MATAVARSAYLCISDGSVVLEGSVRERIKTRCLFPYFVRRENNKLCS